MIIRRPKTAVRLVKDLTQRIQPDPSWQLRTRTHLLQRVQRSAEVAHPASVTAKARLKEFLLIVFPGNFLDVVRGPVMAMLSVFGLVLGGSIASVSASERSVPGDLLYPVKLATEQARVLLVKERSQKVRLKTEFAARRVEEIKTIKASDDPSKPAHIQAAIEGLKNDLDTVRLQLHETNEQASPSEAALTAKLVDQKSNELLSALKDVKMDLPQESQLKVAEAESAAVNTGVKAVQLMIDSHQSPNGHELVSSDEIKQAISHKVEGLEAGIADATSRVINIGGGSATSSLESLGNNASTSMQITGASSTSSLREPIDQLKSAKTSLEQTRQLLQENKLGEAQDKLGEAAKAVTIAEKSVDTVVVMPAQIFTSDSKGEPKKEDKPGGSTTSTPDMTTSTVSLPVQSTSTTSTLSATDSKAKKN